MKISSPLSLHQNPTQQQQDQKIREAAKAYERMFLDEMVKSMRKTVQHSDLTKPSMGESIYLDKMYENYVDNWSDVGGVGLSQVIYDQIHERFFPAMSSPPPDGPLPINKPTTPLQLNQPDENLQIKTEAKDGQNISFQLRAKNLKTGAQGQVVSPWSGHILSAFQAGERAGLIVQHGSNLRSTLSFVGQPLAGLGELRNQPVQEGQPLGVLDLTQPSLSWKVTKNG